MDSQITTFKIRVDGVREDAVFFELFAGEKVNDTYVNVIRKGGYGVAERIVLTPKQFADFCNRLIAYVYTGRMSFTDEQLSILFDTKIDMFDHQSHLIGTSIFSRNYDRIKELSEKRKLEKEKRKKRE
jgi:hypothetical protein